MANQVIGGERVTRRDVNIALAILGEKIQSQVRPMQKGLAPEKVRAKAGWLRRVEEYVIQMYGLTLWDLPDVSLDAWYRMGLSSRGAAQKAMAMARAA